MILPAFGASLEEMELLDSKGVTTVDTTCPWVSKVWTTVDKHQRADMTSLIHGKWQHEEAVATASMCDTYLIVKNMDEAAMVASYILQEDGCLTTEQLMAKFKDAMSPHFDPKKHLKRMFDSDDFVHRFLRGALGSCSLVRRSRRPGGSSFDLPLVSHLTTIIILFLLVVAFVIIIRANIITIR